MSTLTISNASLVGQPVAGLYATDYLKLDNGTTTYKLHVEGVPFTGEIYTRLTAQTNMKLCGADFIPYGQTLNLTGLTGQNAFVEGSVTNVTIPVGVYDCSIALDGVEHNIESYAEAQCVIEYRPNYPVTTGLTHLEGLWVSGSPV